MLNIHDLEKRWLQYKIKSYLPYIVLALSIIFIVTATIFFLNKDEQTNHATLSQNKPSKKVEQSKSISPKTIEKQDQNSAEKAPLTQTIKIKPKKQESMQETTKENIIANEPLYETKKVQTVQQSSSAQTNQNSSNTILKPSMNFMKNLQSSTPRYYQVTPTTPTVDTEKKVKQVEKKTTKKRKEISKQTTPKEEYISIETQTPSKEEKVQKPREEKIQITIKRRESENDIKDVIRRFQKNNNPALSLFVAKQYYELGNYKQAYNYALVTNKINNDIEESWLIFAKSLVKLGKKDQAINTLREYIKFSHSSNAQVLLDEIQRGKFR